MDPAHLDVSVVSCDGEDGKRLLVVGWMNKMAAAASHRFFWVVGQSPSSSLGRLWRRP